MTITIRLAACADAPAIARVHVDSWRTTYRGLMPDAVLDGLSYEGRERQWRALLCEHHDSAFGGFAFVAEDQAGTVVGFASGSREREGDPVYEGELPAIYLLASHQRQGTGRRLVAAVADRLASIGITSMLLWVLAENHPSSRFYERIGGRVVRSKPYPYQVGDASLEEVAYGWTDLTALRALDETLGAAPVSALDPGGTP